MTWCEYRKIGLESEPLAVSRWPRSESGSGLTANGQRLSVGSAGGVDLGSLLLVAGGLAIVLHLATSKRVAGFGR